MNLVVQILNGSDASLEVFSDRMEISHLKGAKHKLGAGDRDIVYYRDIRSISVREIGIFKSGFIEFATATKKRVIDFNYADLNSQVLGIQSFVLKQMQKF